MSVFLPADIFSGLDVGHQPPVKTLVPASEVLNGSFRIREKERGATIKVKPPKNPASARAPGSTKPPVPLINNEGLAKTSTSVG